MSTVIHINNFIQAKLEELQKDEISAVEMADYLHQAGILNDSEIRPGLPLRNYLRDGKIIGGFQYPNKRWVIRKTRTEKKLSIREAADKLKISEQTLYKRIERDQIRTERIGNRVVIPISEVKKGDESGNISFDALGNEIVGLRLEAEKLIEKIYSIEQIFNKLIYPEKKEQQINLNNSDTKMEVQMGKITLHDEIELILKEAGRSMSTSEIADLVNKRQNYSKRDGSLITAFQIHGRTKNYGNLFIRNGSMVSLMNADRKVPERETADNGIENFTNYDFRNEDVTTKDFLIRMGFISIGNVETLLSRGLPQEDDLNSSGVYAITKPADYMPEYIAGDKKLKNVLSPWAVERLKGKWVENTDILYYGIAGSQSPRTLKQRLNDLLQHCCGNTTDHGPHKGGEIIWQLNGYENFEIWILPVPFEKSPRSMEEALLAQFREIKNSWPFANRQG